MRKLNVYVAIIIALILVFSVPIAYATPIVKSVPEKSIAHVPVKSSTEHLVVNYSNVDTIYGQVKVPQEAYQTMGKEKITEKYKEYLKLQDEFKKMDKQLGINRSSLANDLSDMTSVQIKSSYSTNLLLEDDGSKREMTYFDRTNQNWYPTLLWGAIFPTTFSYGEEIFHSYQEREVYLNNIQDCIEIVCDQIPDRTWIDILIYDNDYYNHVPESVFNLCIQNSNPVQYCIILDTEDQSYDIWLLDMMTDEVFLGSYTDNDDFSSYIEYYTGSTEFDDYSLFAHQFNIKTSFIDFYTKVNGNVVQPYNYFNNIYNTADETYVYSSGYGLDGQTYSFHRAANPNPTYY